MTLDFEEVEQLVEELLSLKALNVIGDEMLSFVHEEYLQKMDIFKQNKDAPSQIKTFANNVIKSVRLGNIKDFKKDILEILNIVETLQKYKILDFAKDNDLMQRLQFAIEENDSDMLDDCYNQIIFQIIESLKPYDEKIIKEEVVDVFLSSQIVQRLMPDIMNLAVFAISNNFNIEWGSKYKVNVVWQKEKEVIANIIYNFKEIAHKLLPIIKNEGLQNFDLEKFKDLPVQKLGLLINSLRDSQLFGELYYKTITKLVASNMQNAGFEEDKIFEFVDLATIDWAQELQVLQNFLQSFFEQQAVVDIKNINMFDLDFEMLEQQINLAFEQSLTKEIIFKSLYIAPHKLADFLKGSLSEELNDFSQTVAITLQSMTVEQVKEDLLNILAVIDNLKGVAKDLSINGLIHNLEQLEEQQIKTALDHFMQSKIGENIFPQIVNIVIAKINESLQINTGNISANIAVNNINIDELANTLYQIKNLYVELDPIINSLNTQELLNLSNMELLQNIDFDKLGTILNKLKNTYPFDNIYSNFIAQTILNEEFITKHLPTEMFNYMYIEKTKINAIDWSCEMQTVEAIIDIVIDFESSKNGTVTPLKIQNMLSRYGDSVLLNIASVSVISHLFPEGDVEIIKNISFKTSACIIGGISEIVFLYIDFKYDGSTPKIDSMQRYRIREAIKRIEQNKGMLDLIENLSNVRGIDYAELSFVMDVLYDLLEGKKFEIRALLPYINSVELFPWVIEVIEKFSTGYKLPYYLNIYMRIGLFDTEIKLYSIHLGKLVVADENNVKEPVTKEEIMDIFSYLEIIPSFITAQFVFDPTFEQPEKITEIPTINSKSSLEY